MPVIPAPPNMIPDARPRRVTNHSLMNVRVGMYARAMPVPSITPWVIKRVGTCTSICESGYDWMTHDRVRGEVYRICEAG